MDMVELTPRATRRNISCFSELNFHRKFQGLRIPAVVKYTLYTSPGETIRYVIRTARRQKKSHFCPPWKLCRHGTFSNKIRQPDRSAGPKQHRATSPVSPGVQYLTVRGQNLVHFRPGRCGKTCLIK